MTKRTPQEQAYYAARDGMTTEEYRAIVDLKNGPKYGNRRTVAHGITFDSAREAARYQELRLLEKAGEIRDLTLQPRYDFAPNRVWVGYYVADFRYLEKPTHLRAVDPEETEWPEVVEDVKGGNATKTPVYRLKKKLMVALHGIVIRETL